MSVWTHVCGCIRVDDIPHKDFDRAADIRRIMGNIIDWGSWSEGGTKLPCGSEGSLKYEILQNPSESSIARFTIPIWGDLRDYNDDKEIEEWFNDVCSQMWIRDAVININVEGGVNRSVVYKQNEQ